MKQEINLEKVLNEYNIYLNPYVKEHLQLKAAINDIICKVLDLAAENAEVDYYEDSDTGEIENIHVEKSFILQIKEWVK